MARRLLLVPLAIAVALTVAAFVAVVNAVNAPPVDPWLDDRAAYAPFVASLREGVPGLILFTLTLAVVAMLLAPQAVDRFLAPSRWLRRLVSGYVCSLLWLLALHVLWRMTSPCPWLPRLFGHSVSYRGWWPRAHDGLLRPHFWEIGQLITISLTIAITYYCFAAHSHLVGDKLLPLRPWRTRRERRLARGMCPKCAYPMGRSAVCTECGVRLPPRGASDDNLR